eukprot:5815194-Amphidinium_carterae.2
MEIHGEESPWASIVQFMAAVKDDLDDAFLGNQENREVNLYELKLKRKLFKELDVLETSRLGSAELYAFAKEVFRDPHTHSSWLKDQPGGQPGSRRVLEIRSCHIPPVP